MTDPHRAVLLRRQGPLRAAPPLVALLLACVLFSSLVALLPRPARGAGERLAALLQQLHETDPEMRRNALLGLADQGDASVVPQVAAALRDQDLVARKLAEQALWAIWSRSGNDEVVELLRAGSLLLARGQSESSVRVFSQVIERAPGFAEGYNKRATAYYQMGAYEQSLKDIDETLRRNPLHFGALSGAGLCMVELERFDDALGFFERALKINPNLDRIGQLRRALEKRRKKSVI